MSTRISATLVQTDAREIACMACGHVLGPAGEPWKPAAQRDESPLAESAGLPYTNAPGVVLRRFYCPACSALLDTESALPEDPFLNDIVKV